MIERKDIMTVGRLIELLSKFDYNDEIFVYGTTSEDGSGSIKITHKKTTDIEIYQLK